MASCTTATWGNSDSPRLRLDVSISSQTDTTATLSWALYYVAPYPLSSSVSKSYSAVVAGSTVKSGTYSVNGKTGTNTIASGTKTIAKKSTAQTISFSCSMDINAYWNSVYKGTISASGTISVAAITTYAPIAPSSVASVRSDDSLTSVSWVLESDTTHPYSSLKLQRQVDGGSFSDLATVATTATSYADTTTAANHSYAYRLVATNGKGSATSAATATTYNTPAAPTAVSASRLAETTVSLAITNPANTATALEIQRSQDAATWEDIATIDGAPVTSATDTPGGGTFYYRARNTRDDLISAWSPASNAVVTITPPAAPTITAPASGATIATSTASINVAWLHNSIDGSAQTSAEIDYSTDGGETWTAATVTGTASTYAISNNFTANTDVSIRVRTKGAHADYGEYSAVRTVYIRQTPTVYFAEPSAGFIVENMPIAVQVSYTDISGELANLQLEITDANGRNVYSLDMGTALQVEITPADFLPENGQSYTLTATARSSSTLSAIATANIDVQFVPPMDADLYIEPDAETGYANIVVTIVEDDEKEESISVSLYRISNGSRVLLAEGLTAGSSFEDKYAPLRTDYQYEAVSFAASGAYSTTTFTARIQTPWFFMYAGNTVARARKNPSGSVSLSRPSKRRIFYAGRTNPVSYDDTSNVLEQRTFTAIVDTKQDADAFAEIVYAGGRAVFKSADGDVMHVDADIKLTPDYQSRIKYGAIEVTLYKIDGAVL